MSNWKPWWDAISDYRTLPEKEAFLREKDGLAPKNQGTGTLGSMAVGYVAGSLLFGNTASFRNAGSLSSVESYSGVGISARQPKVDPNFQWAVDVVMKSALPIVVALDLDPKVSVEAYIEELADEGRPSWIGRSSSFIERVEKVDAELFEAGFIPQPAFLRLPELKSLYWSLIEENKANEHRTKKLGKVDRDFQGVSNEVKIALGGLDEGLQPTHMRDGWLRHFRRPVESKAAEGLYLCADTEFNNFSLKLLLKSMVFASWFGYQGLGLKDPRGYVNSRFVVGSYFTVIFRLIDRAGEDGGDERIALKPSISKFFKEDDLLHFAKSIGGVLVPIPSPNSTINH